MDLKSKEDRFNSLCSSYEKLLEKEQFALKERNLEYLERISDKKADFIKALQFLNLPKSDKLIQKLNRLKLLQDNNTSIIESSLDELNIEMLKTSSKQGNVSNIKGSYIDNSNNQYKKNQFEA